MSAKPTRPKSSLTISELAAESRRLIGRTGLFHDLERPNREALYWPVKVLDARVIYGRWQLLIEPVGGRGKTWTNADRVELEKK